MEKTVSEAIAHRRSVRVFKAGKNIEDHKIEACLRNATLAPTSSNLQLWEFYHIKDEDTLQKMTKACLGQNAAKTAEQLVVVVARKDLWRKRAKANVNFLNPNLAKKPILHIPEGGICIEVLSETYSYHLF